MFPDIGTAAFNSDTNRSYSAYTSAPTGHISGPIPDFESLHATGDKQSEPVDTSESRVNLGLTDSVETTADAASATADRSEVSRGRTSDGSDNFDFEPTIAVHRTREFRSRPE